MSRLTLLHIHLIGLFVAIVVGLGLYFLVITKAQEQIKTNQQEYEAVKADADKLPAAKAALKKAQEDKARTERDYAFYNANYMPVLGYTNDRVTTMARVWWPNNGKSWPERFIAGVRRFMDAERKKYGVQWLNPEVITMGPFGPDPNSIDMGDANNTLKFGPYALSVQAKSYPLVMAHLKDWTSVRGLGVPTVEGVTLTGTSPKLIASYAVTFTVILKEKVPPTDPRVGGAGGGRGGFGAMGGPGGMMFGPGGPMGGSMMGGSMPMMGQPSSMPGMGPGGGKRGGAAAVE
ncbi:MAG: hypothetical protein ACP5VE_05755 [Chthonomonadales bacterium]